MNKTWRRGRRMVEVGVDWRIMGIAIDVVRSQHAWRPLWRYNWPYIYRKRAWRVAWAILRQNFHGMYSLRLGPVEIATYSLNDEGVKRKDSEETAIRT